jgi:hypothetical protein
MEISIRSKVKLIFFKDESGTKKVFKGHTLWLDDRLAFQSVTSFTLHISLPFPYRNKKINHINKQKYQPCFSTVTFKFNKSPWRKQKTLYQVYQSILQLLPSLFPTIHSFNLFHFHKHSFSISSTYCLSILLFFNMLSNIAHWLFIILQLVTSIWFIN